MGRSSKNLCSRCRPKESGSRRSSRDVTSRNRKEALRPDNQSIKGLLSLAAEKAFNQGYWKDEFAAMVKDEFDNEVERQKKMSGRTSRRDNRQSARRREANHRRRYAGRRWLSDRFFSTEHEPWDERVIENMADEIEELVNEAMFTGNLESKRRNAGEDLASDVDSIMYDYLYDKAIEEDQRDNPEYARMADVIRFQVFDSLAETTSDAYREASEQEEERGNELRAQDLFEVSDGLRSEFRQARRDDWFPGLDY